MINILFPNDKRKAVTFSYDDGIKQDIKLIEILNKYNLKATFNISSGLFDEKEPWQTNGVIVPRLKADKILNTYKGHEIASHSLTHPNLAAEVYSNKVYQILSDKHNLETLLEKPILGMAYPFGGYDSDVKSILKSSGILYGRTVLSTHNFNLPEDFYEWHPTCHHNDRLIEKLTQDFIKLKPMNSQIFYIWGHSYEFEVDNNWSHIEKITKLIANKTDIWYATNGEIAEYCEAFKLLWNSQNEKLFKNHSHLKLYFEVDNIQYEINSGEVLIIK